GDGEPQQAAMTPSTTIRRTVCRLCGVQGRRGPPGWVAGSPGKHGHTALGSPLVLRWSLLQAWSPVTGLQQTPDHCAKVRHIGPRLGQALNNTGRRAPGHLERMRLGDVVAARPADKTR